MIHGLQEQIKHNLSAPKRMVGLAYSSHKPFLSLRLFSCS
ncbi:hypothetical protein LEP1GSC192_0969 [Leptospira sp. B5-022]|nr:hypothetical protein LEP1GSC192_0969 [Leptospira sp. B5-022]